MKKVYENLEFAMVGHMKSLLESKGIKCEIRNEGGVSVAGEVPFTQVYPELWVLSNGDVPTAKKFVAEYRETLGKAEVGPAWKCPSCGEEVEGQFGECWNCGAAAPEKT
ncbi:putative signal transducing protein [Haloferula sp.]|uniref:putative signal transducing protein n=1 Tax=Haloferula sp. TaxID=2497595 RepID=UPI00329E7060